MDKEKTICEILTGEKPNKKEKLYHNFFSFNLYDVNNNKTYQENNHHEYDVIFIKKYDSKNRLLSEINLDTWKITFEYLSFDEYDEVIKTKYNVCEETNSYKETTFWEKHHFNKNGELICFQNSNGVLVNDLEKLKIISETTRIDRTLSNL